jgi:hypothetical protein
VLPEKTDAADSLKPHDSLKTCWCLNFWAGKKIQRTAKRIWSLRLSAIGAISSGYQVTASYFDVQPKRLTLTEEHLMVDVDVVCCRRRQAC